jgi:CCR4-NOT transcription complex subunit 6
LEVFNSKKWPVIITGDFNSLPDSAVYQFLSQGFVDPNHLELFYSSKDKEDTKKNKLKGSHRQPYFLQSVYGQYFKGSEPPFTNYQEKFQGTLDYIFYEKQNLLPTSLLELPSVESVSVESYLPNSITSSDHISLQCNFILLT